MLHYKNGKLVFFKQKNEYKTLSSDNSRAIKNPIFTYLNPLQGRLIALLGLLLVTVNACWLWLDKKPFAWDESIHYMGAVGYHRALLEHGLKGLGAFWTQSDFYPPLTEWLTGLVFLVTNPNPDIAAFLNVVYLLGILIAMLQIGKKLFTIDSAILAAYAFLTAATISIQAKYYMLDIPLTFYTIWAIFAYLQTNFFTRFRWSALYALIFGLAMLTKWSAVFFLALPPVITAVVMTIKRHDAIKKIWLNVLMIYGLTMLIAFPWYGLHLIKLIKNTAGYFFERGVLENDPTYLTPQAWWYYALGLLKQLSLPVGLVTLFGLIFAVMKRKNLLLMGLWLGLPYVIFSFIGNKDFRYTIPMLPLLCLVAANGINQFSDKSKNKVLLISAVILIAQLLYSHFGVYAGRAYQVLNSKLGSMPIIESMAPDHREWPIASILSDVKESAKQLGRPPLCRIVPDSAQFSKVTFVVEQSKQPFDVKLASITNWPSFTDFAVTKTGNLGLPFLIDKQKAITDSLLNTSTANTRFEQIQSYDLPDGSKGLLYKRIEKPFIGLPSSEITALLKSQLEQLIGHYIKSSDSLDIAIEAFSPQETSLGRFKRITISTTKGLVGDFKHKPLGLPYEQLSITLDDLILDLEEVGQGQLLPFALKTMTINAFTMIDSDINQVFTQQQDELQKCRLNFNQDQISCRYLSKLPLEVSLSLKIKADKHEKNSDNLFFKINRVTIGKLSLPGWMIQPLINDFNPIFKLSGFPVQVKLGNLLVDSDKLLFGTTISSQVKLAP